MRSAFRNLLLLGATTLAASTTLLWGQAPNSRPEVDVAVTYAAQRSNITPGDFFWRQGGTAELSAELFHGFGFAVNFAGAEASDIVSTGINLDTLTITAGPRYAWRPSSQRFSVFGQGLVGESHGWNSLFPKAGAAVSSADSLALQVGGGVDFRVGQRLAVRPIQADWVRTQFPNATTNVQNDLRLGAGVVLRIR